MKTFNLRYTFSLRSFFTKNISPGIIKLFVSWNYSYRGCGLQFCEMSSIVGDSENTFVAAKKFTFCIRRIHFYSTTFVITFITALILRVNLATLYRRSVQ